jgi:hypothetical protein
LDTNTFLALVLPNEGLRCVALALPKGLRQFHYATNEQAAAAVAKIDAAGKTAYFACASFLTDENRRGDNAAAVRSFWLDIDCGEGKPYATQKDGGKALLGFAKLLGLPQPYVVKSGNGLHAYWPMEQDMAPFDWREVAAMLKQATVQAGFAADPSRTADIASILRPVGTHHRKGEPKRVELAIHGQVSSLDFFRQQLERFLDTLGVAPAYVSGPRLNDDLCGGGTEFPPAHADLIADRCKVIGTLRDTRGNVDQPTWYHSLGVLRHCVDGDKVAHEWSSGHPHYSAAETDAKLLQLSSYRPTTCSRLADYQPEICGACPHFARGGSPISLGFQTEEVAVQVPDPVNPEVVRTITLPSGYRYAPARQGEIPSLQFATKDLDGNDVWTSFCATLFYPVGRIFSDEGYLMELEMVVRDNVTRRFVVDCAVIAEGGKALSGALGRYEIVAMPKMKTQIEAYLARWMDEQRASAEEIATYKHFGWHENDFLIGNTLVTTAGSRNVLLRGTPLQKSSALVPKGSYEVWKDVINSAYNYPGQEAFQYLVTLSFAAPLFSLFRQFGGVTVYAHSEGTGVGKTTAQRAGLSAWGNWQSLQLADGKVTLNSLWALVGTYCHLPVLFDELTNQSGSLASEVVFSVSSGRQKERLNSDGSLKDNNSNWSTILMASGNVLLTEKLAQHRANAEAEISRLFEFTVSNTSTLSPNEAGELFPKLLDNYGHAGQIYAEYIVANRDKIEQALLKVQQAFNSEAFISQGERYWSALQASVLVALKICNRLGILGFDPVALKQWIIEQIQVNRQQRQESVTDPLEQFANLFAELWQGVLVTNGEGDLRKNLMADVIQHPRGPMVGRVIVGMDANERTLLLLNAQAVKEWCYKRGASAKEMFSALVAAGLASPRHVRYSLGKGTLQYGQVGTQIKCWEIDCAKVGAGSVQIAQRLRVVEQQEKGSNDARRDQSMGS